MTTYWPNIRLCWLRSRATPGRTCGSYFLYWNFLLQHEDTLRANPRLGRSVLALRHLDEDERGAVRRRATAFLDKLDYDERTPS